MCREECRHAPMAAFRRNGPGGYQPRANCFSILSTLPPFDGRLRSGKNHEYGTFSTLCSSQELDTAEFDGLGIRHCSRLIWERSNEIAESAELTHVAHYADNRPIPEDFEGDPDELAEIMGEWTDSVRPK